MRASRCLSPLWSRNDLPCHLEGPWLVPLVQRTDSLRDPRRENRPLGVVQAPHLDESSEGPQAIQEPSLEEGEAGATASRMNIYFIHSGSCHHGDHHVFGAFQSPVVIGEEDLLSVISRWKEAPYPIGFSAPYFERLMWETFRASPVGAELRV